MKKILTILLILLLSQVCFAGRVQQAHKAVIAANSGGDSCSASPAVSSVGTGIQLDEMATYYYDQQVINSSTKEICKIDIYISNSISSNQNFTINIRSANNNGGDLLGDSKIIVVTASDSGSWYTITWETNNPTITGTYYINTHTTNNGVRARMQNTGSINGSMYIGATEYSTYDMAVKVYYKE